MRKRCRWEGGWAQEGVGTGWDGLGLAGTAGTGWDGLGRDGTGWDAMGRDGTGWEHTQSHEQPSRGNRAEIPPRLPASPPRASNG
jgi:hypothetical protein